MSKRPIRLTGWVLVHGLYGPEWREPLTPRQVRAWMKKTGRKSKLMRPQGHSGGDL